MNEKEARDGPFFLKKDSEVGREPSILSDQLDYKYYRNIERTAP